MTSVLQGGIRFNNLMGFAIIGGVFGAAGTASARSPPGSSCPSCRPLTTLAFALAPGRRAVPRCGGSLRQVLLNPLILGCLAASRVGAGRRAAAGAAAGGCTGSARPRSRSACSASARR